MDHIQKLPDLSQTPYALFLDIDGTLLDIALEPGKVIVPPFLLSLLKRLSQGLHGAIAIITGRSIENVEKILHPYPFSRKFAIAGLHGAQISIPGKEIKKFIPPKEFLEAKNYIESMAKDYPDLLFEDKYSLATLHFRKNKSLAPQATQIMEKALKLCEKDYAIQKGKEVLELKPKAIDKGFALRYFMQHSPFSNYLPLSIGDDISDEAMFLAAKELGGLSIKVCKCADQFTTAPLRIATPHSLLTWLARQKICRA